VRHDLIAEFLYKGALVRGFLQKQKGMPIAIAGMTGNLGLNGTRFLPRLLCSGNQGGIA
jgi:hypothetical protein